MIRHFTRLLSVGSFCKKVRGLIMVLSNHPVYVAPSFVPEDEVFCLIMVLSSHDPVYVAPSFVPEDEKIMVLSSHPVYVAPRLLYLKMRFFLV